MQKKLATKKKLLFILPYCLTAIALTASLFLTACGMLGGGNLAGIWEIVGDASDPRNVYIEFEFSQNGSGRVIERSRNQTVAQAIAQGGLPLTTTWSVEGNRLTVNISVFGTRITEIWDFSISGNILTLYSSNGMVFGVYSREGAQINTAAIPQNHNDIDLFRDLNIELEGISPFLSLALANDSGHEFLSQVSFRADRTSNLAIGDEVTIIASFSDNLAWDLGYAPQVSEFSFIIPAENITSHVNSFEQIDNAAFGQVLDASTAYILNALEERGNRIFAAGTGSEGLNNTIYIPLESDRFFYFEYSNPIPIRAYMKNQIRNFRAAGRGESLQNTSVSIVFRVEGSVQRTGMLGRDSGSEDVLYISVLTPNFVINENGKLSMNFDDTIIMNSLLATDIEALHSIFDPNRDSRVRSPFLIGYFGMQMREISR